MDLIAPELWLVLFVGILAATLFGWLALWAAAGRFRWYWHAAPLVLALTALVPLGGIDPLLMFGVQAATIVFYEAVRKWNASRRKGTPFITVPRFGLSDVLAAMALVGAMLAIGRFRPVSGMPLITISPDHWVFSGNGFGMATLTVSQLIMDRAGIRRRLLNSVLLVVGSIALLLSGDLTDAVYPYSRYGTPSTPWSYGWALVFVVAQGGATTVWLFLLQAAGWSWWRGRRPDDDHEGLSSRIAASRGGSTLRFASRIGVTVVTGGIVWAVAGVYWHILPPFSVPTVVVPALNGMEDVLPLSKQLNWNAIPNKDVPSANNQQYGQFARDNEEPLRRIRESLTKEWMNSNGHTDFKTSMQFCEAMFDLMRALWVDACYQAFLGRFDLAARDHLDMVRLANHSTLGGQLNEELVANMVAGAGQFGLVTRMDHFDPLTLREIAYTLELDDGMREPVEAIDQRNNLALAIHAGWLGRLVYWTDRQTHGPANLGSMTHSRAQCDARLRLTAGEAAIRAYQAEHGAPPDSLDALVPGYLSAVPKDPFDPLGTASLRYRREGDTYLLYSVGYDRYDDHGLRVETIAPQRGYKRDLFFDSPDP